MTSRERIRKAIARQAGDVVPARFNAAPNDQTLRLAGRLGLARGDDWYEALFRRFRIDMRNVDPEVKNGDYGGDNETMCAAQTTADIDRLWPAKIMVANRSFDNARRQVELWDRSGNPPALQARLGGLFGSVRRLRGDTNAFMDLADGSDLFIHLMDRLEAYLAGMIDLAFAAFGQRLDLVHIGDEIGMQTGLMFSPHCIRAHFFPRFRRLFAQIHRQGAFVFYHSCGAIAPLIGELAELGVDVLNPIQPRLPGMDAGELAGAHGGRICFCGGLDMQRLMPCGTPAEVQAEARCYMRVLAPGYILDLANILHPDIPDENVIALYDTPREIEQT